MISENIISNSGILFYSLIARLVILLKEKILLAILARLS